MSLLPSHVSTPFKSSLCFLPFLPLSIPSSLPIQSNGRVMWCTDTPLISQFRHWAGWLQLKRLMCNHTQNCRGWKGPRDIIGSNPHVGELGGNHVNSLRVMPWLLYYQSLWGQKVLCSVLEGWRWGITWHCCYRDGCFCLLLFSSHLMQLMTSDT